MSDSSQGAGWWIASDGKWYPPHLAPGAPPLPPPPSPGAPVGVPSASAAPVGSVGNPPSQTHPKKNRTGRWIGIGVGVVVLIIIIAAAAGGSKNKTPSATDASTTPTTAASTGSTANTSPPTTKAPGQPTGKDGTFAFTVTGQQCGLTTVGTDPLTQTAPAGSSWCVDNFTVTNDKGSSGDISPETRRPSTPAISSSRLTPRP